MTFYILHMHEKFVILPGFRVTETYANILDDRSEMDCLNMLAFLADQSIQLWAYWRGEYDR